MKSTRPCQSFCALAAFAFAASLNAQTPPAPKLEIPEPSPTATLKQRIGVTDVEITYSRPGMRGRKVFGDHADHVLEPNGEIWRAGANSATKVTFSTPVKIGGTELPAGSYGLFALLGPDEWTIIVNKIPNQWGAYSYDAKDDVVRVPAKVVALAAPVETFTIDLNDLRDESATLTLSWEKTRVGVKLEFDTVRKVVPQIEAFMASDAAKKPYVPAAMFYLEHNVDLPKAITWMDAAIAAQPDAFYYIYRKAKIQAAMGDKAGALASAQKSIEMAAKAPPAIKDEYTRLNEMVIAGLK